MFFLIKVKKKTLLTNVCKAFKLVKKGNTKIVRLTKSKFFILSEFEKYRKSITFLTSLNI